MLKQHLLKAALVLVFVAQLVVSMPVLAAYVIRELLAILAAPFVFVETRLLGCMIDIDEKLEGAEHDND